MARRPSIELPTIDFLEPRVLGCLPPKPNFAGLPRWGDSKPMIARSEWRDVSWRTLNARIMDQDGLGACAGFAGVNAFERAWRLAGGQALKFSAWFLYSNVNGGRDQGALISDVLKSLLATGVCLEDQVPEKTYQKRSIKPDAYTTAKRFRIAEAYALDSTDAIGSAVMLGYPIEYGIFVGGNFMTLDAGGVPGIGSDGGHALHCCGLRKVPAGPHKGQWSYETENSWGTKYGQDGYCYVVDKHFDSMQKYGLDAFAIKAVAGDPQDPLPAPL
jgi:hypothetical protein